MSSHRTALIMTTICLVLAGSAFASSELLYVQEGHNLVTYSVDSTTAVATKLSTLWMHADPIFGIQILRDPAGPYLYIFISLYLRIHFLDPGIFLGSYAF